MINKLRPLYDRVLIQRLELEEKTASGIIIPDIAKEKGQTGKVIAVGGGKVTNDGRVIPMQVKVGDIVYFGKYAGNDTGEYVVVREDEILGIID